MTSNCPSTCNGFPSATFYWSSNGWSFGFPTLIQVSLLQIVPLCPLSISKLTVSRKLHLLIQRRYWSPHCLYHIQLSQAPDSCVLLSFGQANWLQVSLYLAVMADVIYVQTIFTSVSLLPTPATGSLGKWLVQLSLRCVLGIWYTSSRWIGLALWLSHLIHWIRCCPIDCLLGYFCSFFCFLSYLVCLDQGKLIISESEKSFKDCFIVNGTNEPGPQCFIQWVLDWLKVTGHCIRAYSAEQLLKCFYPGFLFKSDQNLYLSLITNPVVLNCSPINFWMSSMLRSLIPFAGDHWTARLLSNL